MSNPSEQLRQRQQLNVITAELSRTPRFSDANTKERYKLLLAAGLPMSLVINMQVEGSAMIASSKTVNYVQQYFQDVTLTEQLVHAVINEGEPVDLRAKFSPAERHYDLTTSHGRALQRRDILAPQLLGSIQDKVMLLQQLEAVSADIETIPEAIKIFERLRIYVALDGSPAVVASNIALYLERYGAVAKNPDGTYIQSEDIFDRALAQFIRRQQEIEDQAKGRRKSHGK